MENDSSGDSSGFNDSTKSSNVKLGRPPTTLNEILAEFTTTKMGKADKDNFSIFIIRAIKKLIKNTLAQQKINPVRFAARMSDSELSLLYESCKPIVDENNEKYTEILNWEIIGIPAQSRIFSVSGIRKIYFILIEVMFQASDISILSSRFNLQCCNSAMHSSPCSKKWEYLKIKLTCNFLSEYYNNPNINTLSDDEHLPPDDSCMDIIF